MHATSQLQAPSPAHLLFFSCLWPHLSPSLFSFSCFCEWTVSMGILFLGQKYCVCMNQVCLEVVGVGPVLWTATALAQIQDKQHFLANLEQCRAELPKLHCREVLVWMRVCRVDTAPRYRDQLLSQALHNGPVLGHQRSRPFLLSSCFPSFSPHALKWSNKT